MIRISNVNPYNPLKVIQLKNAPSEINNRPSSETLDTLLS